MLSETWWYGAAGMTIFALVFACVPCPGSVKMRKVRRIVVVHITLNP